MKTRQCIIAAGLFVLLSISGKADPTTWTSLVVGGNQYWNINSNWDGTFPNAVGAEVVVHGDFKTSDLVLNLGQNITLGSLTIGDTAADPTSGFSIDVVDYSGKTLTFESSVPGGLTYLKVPVDIVQDPSWSSDATIRVPLYIGGTSSLVIEPVGQLAIEAVYFQGNSLIVTNSSTIQNLTLNNQLYGGGSSKLVGNAGILITKNNPSYGGTVEANAGTMTMATGGLPAANLMTINSGGLVVVGNNSTADPNPGQRLPTNEVCLAGGQLNHWGQALKGAALDQMVGDVVNEIKLEKGQSRVEIQTGSTTTSGTYLRAKVLTRLPGTVLAVGANKLGMNLNTTDRGQQFQVEGSLATIGGGGAEGTTTMNVVPWVFCKNTHYNNQPDRIGTLSANGLRGLYDAEMDTTLAGTDNRNVTVSTLALSTDQTVNSLIYNNYHASNFGAGRTLHVTSGAILLLRDNSRIGEIASATAGILDFGFAEGCVYALSISEGNAAIGAVITGTGGLTLAGPGRLRLTGANTYSGTTSIASGLVQVGDGTVNTATARLGAGDVQVCALATLRIASNAANAIANDATVTLQKAGLKNAKMELQTGINETVRFLFFGDEPMTAGTYGGTGSGATNILPNYFTGTGILTVSSNAAALGGTTLIVVR